MIDLRLPNITATTERGQLEQIKGYLFQFAQELNFAVTALENNQSKISNQMVSSSESSAKEQTAKSINEQFNSLKPLIIKSADIVNSYYEEINSLLKGEYEALSDYGNFKQTTELRLQETSDSINQNYELLESIDGWKRNTEAYIRTGWLNSDSISETPVYGMEVGQDTDINGETIFKRFARYTADKITFFDGYGNEMGYLSGKTLYINNIIVKGILYLGDIKLDTSQGGVAAKWAEGEVQWQQ